MSGSMQSYECSILSHEVNIVVLICTPVIPMEKILGVVVISEKENLKITLILSTGIIKGSRKCFADKQIDIWTQLPKLCQHTEFDGNWGISRK